MFATTVTIYFVCDKRDSGFCFCFHNHFLLSPLQGCICAHLHLKNTSLLKIILSQEHMGYRVLDTQQ